MNFVACFSLMKYFVLEPEVAGGIGKNTVLDRTVHPPIPIKFNYEFSGWLGDSLLETVASFIVTKSLGEQINSSSLTGVTFGEVEISKSGQFEDLYPNTELPEFVWLQIKGVAGVDDFGLSPKHLLIVSQAALSVLKQEPLNYCEIAEYLPTKG
jgi:hypothetical protein